MFTCYLLKITFGICVQQHFRSVENQVCFRHFFSSLHRWSSTFLSLFGKFAARKNVEMLTLFDWGEKVTPLPQRNVDPSHVVKSLASSPSIGWWVQGKIMMKTRTSAFYCPIFYFNGNHRDSCHKLHLVCLLFLYMIVVCVWESEEIILMWQIQKVKVKKQCYDEICQHESAIFVVNSYTWPNFLCLESVETILMQQDSRSKNDVQMKFVNLKVQYLLSIYKVDLIHLCTCFQWISVGFDDNCYISFPFCWIFTACK